MPPVITYGHDDTRSRKSSPTKCLTESALQQHVRSSKLQEEITLTRSWTAPKNENQSVDEPSTAPASIEQSLSRLHQDTQGFLSPVERFAKLSPASDPSPWETKKALKKLGFQDDHTQDSDLRLNEAAIAAVSGSVQRVGGPSIVAVAETI